MSSIKKLDSILKKYYEAASATSLYYENHLDNSNARKFLFLIDNKWYSLTVNMSFTTSFYDNKYVKYHDNRLQYFEIVDDFYALPYGIYPASYKLDNTIPKISYYVDYFDKQEHVKELSNTMNNDRGAGWNGVAYIHYIYGKDTLKYKENNVKLNDKTAWDSWTKYEQIPLIYTNSRLDFVIIDDFYITPKQKTNRVNN